MCGVFMTKARKWLAPWLCLRCSLHGFTRHVLLCQGVAQGVQETTGWSDYRKPFSTSGTFVFKATFR